MLAPISFSTRGLARQDQFGAWRDYLTALVDVRLPDNVSVEDGFPADHTCWNIGAMLIVHQNVPAHSYARSEARIRSSTIDHWYVAILRSGRAWTGTDGGIAENRPGQVHFGSLSTPFRGRATASEATFLYLPRDLFAQSAASLDSMNNSILLGNSAALLIDYISSVETRLRSLTAEDLPRVTDATRNMILACVNPSSGREVPAERALSQALMERARRHVQRNLGAGDLSPAGMARALGISRTRLYELFEASGGVIHYIQKRRLLAAHAALSDPQDARLIIDIAMAVGFTSAANFSRAFSKEFGYSPREARNAALLPPPRRASFLVGERSGSFADTLKMLGG